MVAITRSKTLNNRHSPNKRINKVNVKFVQITPMKKVSDLTRLFWVKSLNSKTNMVFMGISQHLDKLSERKTKDEKKKECIKMITFIKNNWEYIQKHQNFCEAVKNKLIELYYNQEFKEIEMFFEFFKIKKVQIQ